MTYQTGINIGLMIGTFFVLRRAAKINNRTNTRLAELEKAEERIDQRNMQVELYNERQRQQEQHTKEHTTIKQQGCAWCQGLAQ